jgi:hypothetical protein
MALLFLGLFLTIPLTAAWQVGPDFSNNFGRPGADTTFDCEYPRSIPSRQNIGAY